MRFTGKLKSWNSDRGYGFIQADQGGQEIFVHLQAIPTAFRPPRVGQAFTFEVELNRDGKKRAGNLGAPEVRRSARATQTRGAGVPNLAAFLAIPLFLLVFAAVASAWRVSLWVPLAYLVLSFACLATYAADKSAARDGRWRTPEQSLLLLGLVGGWPGAIVAQQLLRHKAKKASFQSAFWVTVLLNVAGFVLIHSPFASALRP